MVPAPGGQRLPGPDHVQVGAQGNPHQELQALGGNREPQVKAQSSAGGEDVGVWARDFYPECNGVGASGSDAVETGVSFSHVLHIAVAIESC